MHTAIFIFYFLLLCIAVTRMRFFNDCIRPAYLVLLFGIHAAAGCIHTWVAFRFYPNHGDIWSFFEQSTSMKQAFLIHPWQYISSMFSNEGAFNIADNSQPMLGAQYKILQHINVFLNFISFNNLYINTLLFSFPVFAGTIALFKVFYTTFYKPLPAFCALLLPSVLFWTSVLYKDGLFLMAAGYFLYYLLLTRKSTVIKGILLIVFITLMILSRANALITLLPAMLYFILTEKKHMGKWLSAGITVAIAIVTAVAVNAYIPGGILTRICERQKDFQLLEGGSRIFLPALDPTAASFLAVFPMALVNGFFQPFPGAGGKLIYMAFSIELLLLWAIILFACWLLARKNTIHLSNFDIACLLFALPGMIMIGYMVPFAGAIIRYRSIYLPFLLAPFINIICSYPVKWVQLINDWLYRDVMAIEVEKK
jgi:hypothetical protein